MPGKCSCAMNRNKTTPLLTNVNYQAFEKHVKGFYDSPEFKKKAKEAQPFLDEAKQYLFGIPNTLENIVSVRKAQSERN